MSAEVLMSSTRGASRAVSVPLPGSGEVQVGIVLDVGFGQTDPGDSRAPRPRSGRLTRYSGMQAADGQLVVIVLVVGLEASRDQRKRAGVLGETELGGFVEDAQLLQGRLLGHQEWIFCFMADNETDRASMGSHSSATR